jgi:hypothetical protein
MNKKTSYKVGSMLAVAAIVLSPIAASAETDTTTVQATVNSVISVDSAAIVAMTVTPTGAGAATSATDGVKVYSNDADGYNLTLANSDATSTLTRTGGGAITALVTPGALASNTWGYNLDAGANYTGVPVTGSAVNISSPTTVSTVGGDTINVTYGVKVDTSIPAGVYSDAVTYTATVK